jgi:hypothetical protein
VVKTKEGQDIKFSMDFDFGEHHSGDSKAEEKPEEKPEEPSKEDKPSE